MCSEDTTWDDMLEIAKLQQQEYYELLTEWTEYKKSEYNYLKLNIGFAMFGPPSKNQESNIISHNMHRGTNDSDMCKIYYKPEDEENIHKVYEIICNFGKGCGVNAEGCRCKRTNAESIYYCLIYNITFRIRDNSKASKGKIEKTKDEEEKKNKVKKENEDEEEKKNKVKKENENKEEMKLCQYPIFKIKRHVYDKQKKKCSYEILYIDTYCRVYKDWENYKETNVLPQCTMVLPKGGFYQPDASYEITEEYSRVWLEIVDSPACSTASTVLNYVDNVSHVLSLVGLGLSACSILTPAGPIVAGATITSALTGAWTAGRSTSNLIDRSVHKQSINPTDRNALGSWLCITGGAIGLASSGGNVVLSKLIKDGKTISLATKVAYNSLIAGNLTINGVGIAYQAYCMYEKYQNGEKIETIDVVVLTTHILFFGNTVINQQFAGDLIETTQGKILEEYRATLRSKHLRRRFNRAKRAAAEGNTNKVSENAEVIRYINKKTDLKMKSGNTVIPDPNLIEKRKTMINDITLLDPVQFVWKFINRKHDQFDNVTSVENINDNENMFAKLKDLLLTLLQKFDSNNTNKFDTIKYDEILKDMRCIKDAQSIFLLIFKIAYYLTSKYPRFSDYLVEAVRFVWYYIKASLKETIAGVINMRDRQTQIILNKLITVLYENIDHMEERLLLAFKQYLCNYFKMSFTD
ncbi:hypothetical protein ANTPLA_LOCUS7960 [Anthophora plagiata]